MQNLPLEVAAIDDVEVHEPQRPHSGCREIQRRWRAEPTSADEEDTRGAELQLSLERNIGKREMAGVANQFFLRQRIHRNPQFPPVAPAI